MQPPKRYIEENRGKHCKIERETWVAKKRTKKLKREKNLKKASGKSGYFGVKSLKERRKFGNRVWDFQDKL